MMDPNIKLIMQTKSASCDRCFKKDPSLVPKQYIYKAPKKPESYLVQKFEDLYKEDKKFKDKKSKKLAQFEAKREVEELNECTFQPQINSNEEYFVSTDPFLKREKDWKTSIQKKISAKREAEEQKKKVTYTFKPKITANPLYLTSQSSFSSSQNYTEPKRFGEKKSYKHIHSDRKKLKQLTQTMTIEPFRHRKNQSMLIQDKSLNQSMIMAKTMTTLQHSFANTPLKDDKQASTDRKKNPQSLHQSQIQTTSIKDAAVFPSETIPQVSQQQPSAKIEPNQALEYVDIMDKPVSKQQQPLFTMIESKVETNRQVIDTAEEENKKNLKQPHFTMLESHMQTEMEPAQDEKQGDQKIIQTESHEEDAKEAEPEIEEVEAGDIVYSDTENVDDGEEEIF